jgi:TRAP-type C4-dicarboxylate transport system permease small subunit
MLGAAYAFRTRMHIGLDLLPKHLSGNAARKLRRLTQAVILLFALGVLVIGGAKLVWLTWDLRQYSAVLGLPMAVVYAVIPVTGILIMLFELEAD